jgi:hypothetical protein
MYATMLAVPIPDPDPDRTVVLQSVPFETTPDPNARLEEKLDQAMRMIAAMQQRIESLDATLMRVLMR